MGGCAMSHETTSSPKLEYDSGVAVLGYQGEDQQGSYSTSLRREKASIFATHT